MKRMDMTFTQVTARRLIRQGLAGPVPKQQLAAQVGVICGAHAQVIMAAEVSVALRVEGITRSDVQQALWEKREIVKTYGPRGTVHLLDAEDLPMWTGALSTMPMVRPPTAPNPLLTSEQIDLVVEAIGDILAGQELTVDELTDALVEHLGEWAGDRVMDAFQDKWPRWRSATDIAAHRGALCFAPNKGRKVAYTNPHRWLAKFRPMKGEKALSELLKRYLFAYGPGTPAQFARWLSMTPRWAAELFEKHADELEQVTLDGDKAWVVKGDTELPDEPPSGVRLLPYFDVYVVGSYPREKLFPGKATERALARSQAGNFPVLLIDGIVSGVWHQKRAGKKLKVTVEPLIDLTVKQRRALDDEVQRIGDIQEGTPELTLGKVTVGAHA
jgi:hypothetical protein